MRTLLNYGLLSVFAASIVGAQGHGGGHHGGGGGAGFSSSRPMSSGFSGYSGARALPPASSGLRSPASGYSGINYGAYQNSIHYPARPPYCTYSGVTRGYRVGRPYRYGLAFYPVFGYGDSWYDPSYYAPYDQYPQYDQYSAYPMQDPSVGMTPNYYPPIPYAGDPIPPQSDPTPPGSPIVVILKSGQRIEMQSYGIMNNLLWDFSRPNSRRIPLASIDVAASVKATEAVGGSFPEEFFEGLPK